MKETIDPRLKTQDLRQKPTLFGKAIFCIVFSLWSLVFGLWSCEASTLLYSRLTDGFWQIWKHEDSREPAQLTFSSYDKRYPSITSKGEAIFHSNNDRCFLLTKDGKEEELLADLQPVRDIIASPREDIYVFTKFRHDVIDESHLWVLDTLNNKRQMITQDAGLQYQPAFSWDGTKIVYTAGQGPDSKDIFIINRDGTGKKQLTENKSNDLNPSFSPDGMNIVFSSAATGDNEIWIMGVDGTNAKPLTDAKGLDTRPVFSPDGKTIAFASNRSGKMEIWVMNSDGTNQQTWFTSNEAETCDPYLY